MSRKSRQINIALTAIILLLFQLPAFGQKVITRTWTDSMGNEFVAKLAGMDGDSALLDLRSLFNQNNCGPMWIAVNGGDYRYEEDLKEFSDHHLSVGGKIKSSVFNNKGHDAWIQLYTDPTFQDWLFQQKIE